MTDPYYGGSQHNDPPPIPEDSYLAWWLQAEQAQRETERVQQEQQVQDDLSE